MAIAEVTFYRWRKVHAGMGVSEIRRLKQCEEENDQLKRLVADLTLEKSIVNQWNANGPSCIGERTRSENSGEPFRHREVVRYCRNIPEISEHRGCSALRFGSRF
ncbi:hypothetical protein FGK63_08005 [Ruegeria sediminis]|uniref:Transposase n=1 Tax=Ruegeria sediminis TaxID=2583820 RepID=A0ABY2X1E8_9RHOB|nr:hypothetical protein FGK63_08005 [Ruegeria sediminis]